MQQRAELGVAVGLDGRGQPQSSGQERMLSGTACAKDYSCQVECDHTPGLHFLHLLMCVGTMLSKRGMKLEQSLSALHDFICISLISEQPQTCSEVGV